MAGIFGFNCEALAKAKIARSPVVKIPVFFATDRKTVCSNKDLQGAQLDKLWMGSAKVTVPADKTWLIKSKDELDEQYIKMGWTLDLVGKTQQRLEATLLSTKCAIFAFRKLRMTSNFGETCVQQQQTLQ